MKDFAPWRKYGVSIYPSIGLILNPGARRSGWRKPRPGRFNPGNEPQYQFYRKVPESEGRLDGCGEEKNFLPHRYSNFETYRPLGFALPTTLFRLTDSTVVLRISVFMALLCPHLAYIHFMTDLFLQLTQNIII